MVFLPLIAWPSWGTLAPQILFTTYWFQNLWNECWGSVSTVSACVATGLKWAWCFLSREMHKWTFLTPQRRLVLCVVTLERPVSLLRKQTRWVLQDKGPEAQNQQGHHSAMSTRQTHTHTYIHTLSSYQSLSNTYTHGYHRKSHSHKHTAFVKANKNTYSTYTQTALKTIKMVPNTFTHNHMDRWLTQCRIRRACYTQTCSMKQTQGKMGWQNVVVYTKISKKTPQSERIILLCIRYKQFETQSYYKHAIWQRTHSIQIKNENQHHKTTTQTYLFISTFGLKIISSFPCQSPLLQFFLFFASTQQPKLTISLYAF